MPMPLVDELVYSGFTPEQSKKLAELMDRKSGEFDVAKVGASDAETNADALKLVNALKARLNEVIEALRG